MNHARVWVDVKFDNTGSSIHIPVIFLLVDEALVPLKPLLRYCVVHHNSRSLSWMEKLCEIVGKLLDYMFVNQDIVKPVPLFSGFVAALYNGTFDKNNDDPSGLCWLPSNAKTVNPKLHMLEEFSDWMVRQNYTPESLNPWTVATDNEKRFAWLAWFKKNGNSFLGHLDKSRGASEMMRIARETKLRRKPITKAAAAIAFPANFEQALLRDGFVRPGKQGEVDIVERYDWRGICIAMLMLYGARRVSEPFHLWTGDVAENPTRRGEALVRIYHPIEGQAPALPRINGRRLANRQAYLRAFYPNYMPRTMASGNYHAGFKGRAFTDDKGMYIHVYWLPSSMGQAFLWAYHNYMLQRARMGIDGKRHPFAFVSHHGTHRGEPYSIKAFLNTWARAMRRIGLPHAKIHGTSPHGGRHGAGVRLNKGGADPYIAQEMFAHSSLESQRTYRAPSTEQVSEHMDAATLRMQYEANLRQNGATPTAMPVDWMEIWSTQANADVQRYKYNARKRK